jgi:hypothetical protein
VTCRDKPVDVFVTVTVAFVIMAPVSSVKVPTIEPYRTCADALCAAYPITMKTNAIQVDTTITRETLLAVVTVYLPFDRTRVSSPA